MLPEEARIDPDNLHVLLAHLKAATFELPFDARRDVRAGRRRRPARLPRARMGHVHAGDDGRWYWSSENFPASEISLRTAAPENVVIIDTTPDRPRVLGEVDLFSAQVLVHEHAIYMHETIQYHVDRLEWGERKAYVHRIDADHYTYANRAVTLKTLDIHASAPVPGGRREHGEVMVASLVTFYKKLKFGTDENVGWGPIDLPELELQTTAYWAAADGLQGSWRRHELDVALLGAGRALQTVASVLLMVDPRDLGLVTQVRSPHSERADGLPVRGRAGRGRHGRATLAAPRRAHRGRGRACRLLRLRARLPVVHRAAAGRRRGRPGRPPPRPAPARRARGAPGWSRAPGQPAARGATRRGGRVRGMTAPAALGRRLAAYRAAHPGAVAVSDRGPDPVAGAGRSPRARRGRGGGPWCTGHRRPGRAGYR